jgi:hypothetical protein
LGGRKDSETFLLGHSSRVIETDNKGGSGFWLTEAGDFATKKGRGRNISTRLGEFAPARD